MVTEIQKQCLEKQNLRFEWTHSPDYNELIDPAFTNLIDVFTLSTTYDNNLEHT